MKDEEKLIKSLSRLSVKAGSKSNREFLIKTLEVKKTKISVKIPKTKLKNT